MAVLAMGGPKPPGDQLGFAFGGPKPPGHVLWTCV